MASALVREGEGGPSEARWATAGSNYIEFLGVTLLVAVAVFGGARLLGVSIGDKIECAAKQVAGMEDGLATCTEAGTAAVPGAAPAPAAAFKMAPDGIEGPKNYVLQSADQYATTPPSPAVFEEIAKMAPPPLPPAANPVDPPPQPGMPSTEAIKAIEVFVENAAAWETLKPPPPPPAPPAGP